MTIRRQRCCRCANDLVDLAKKTAFRRVTRHSSGKLRRQKFCLSMLNGVERWRAAPTGEQIIETRAYELSLTLRTVSSWPRTSPRRQWDSSVFACGNPPRLVPHFPPTTGVRRRYVSLILSDSTRVQSPSWRVVHLSTAAIHCGRSKECLSKWKRIFTSKEHLAKRLGPYAMTAHFGLMDSSEWSSWVSLFVRWTNKVAELCLLYFVGYVLGKRMILPLCSLVHQSVLSIQL
jgi:hypothetical protein